MKYRFKAVKYSEDLNLFDRSYNSHEAAMQAAFAYVDLFVEDDSAKEKLVHGVISDFNTSLLSFSHDNTLFMIAPDMRPEVN